MSQDKDDKKKSIALKSRMTAQGEEFDDSFSDEEMVLFVRKMRRLLRYKRKGKGSSSSKDVKKDQVKFTCHHCKEPGHFKSDCSQLKKGEKSKKDKKKVMLATWENLENDTSSDQEAQLCLMADHNDEDEVDLSDLSIDELHYIIKDISVNSKKLLDKYAKCKKENEGLRTENDLLLKKVKANETVNYIKLFMILMLLGNQEDFTSKNPNGFGYLRVINEKTWAVLFVAKRSDNVYGITLDDLKVQNVTCFSSMESEKWMWHKNKAYRVYNKNSKTVEETMHVTFCESNNVPSVCIDDSPGFEAELPKNTEPVPQNPSSHEVTLVNCKNSNSAGDNLELSPVTAENTDAEAIVDQEKPGSSTQIRRPSEWKFLKNYPEKFTIGDPSKSISTRSSLKRDESKNLALLSKIEPQKSKKLLLIHFEY
nr:uncharacterized protein LOC112762986 [Arachis hypogaea]